MRCCGLQRNVAYTQAKGTLACFHVGSIAIYFGDTGNQVCRYRLELFTPRHRFRFSRPRLVQR
jgi:hypothetical protein